MSALDILEELPSESKLAEKVKDILVFAPEDREHGGGRGFVGKQTWGPRSVYAVAHLFFSLS